MLQGAPAESSAVVNARPSTIWQTCFASFEWEDWDPGIVRIEDIPGQEMADGAKLVLVMGGCGRKLQTTLRDVRRNSSFTFTGSIYGGAIRYTGRFRLEPVNEDQTSVTYSFGVHGLLGHVYNAVDYSNSVVSDTEEALSNIKMLSEEAEKHQTSQSKA